MFRQQKWKAFYGPDTLWEKEGTPAGEQRGGNGNEGGEGSSWYMFVGFVCRTHNHHMRMVIYG